MPQQTRAPILFRWMMATNFYHLPPERVVQQQLWRLPLTYDYLEGRIPPPGGLEGAILREKFPTSGAGSGGPGAIRENGEYQYHIIGAQKMHPHQPHRIGVVNQETTYNRQVSDSTPDRRTPTPETSVRDDI